MEPQETPSADDGTVKSGKVVMIKIAAIVRMNPFELRFIGSLPE
jgi:hypothetical protein